MLTCGKEVPAAAGAPGGARASASALARTQPEVGRSDKPPTVAATAQTPMAGMGTNALSRGEVAPHPSVDHTRVMSDLMSPGAERQMLRRATILKGTETDAAAAGTPAAVAPEVARAARRQEAIGAFVDVADGIGQALAGDDLALYYERITALPTVFTLLRREFGTNQPLGSLVQQAIIAGLPLSAAGQWRTTKDLAEARALFLPFSTATVDLAKALRKEGEPFTGLKIYHCPTATKPELWMQAKGPPRNPFQGPKEPVCGEEVKP